uniref:Uncharacterized protein n=1 Tax=Glossina palpalis gambiensis TaxID=67801 RepID=A0A1B0B9G3_9MUSC
MLRFALLVTLCISLGCRPT